MPELESNALRGPAAGPSSGPAGWSVRRPVGVVMISLAVVVLGMFALGRLGVDLLPHVVYPEVVVSVSDRGVPASVMEDQVTRHLEEQLAITEGALDVSSRTSEGRSRVTLDFGYGKDVDRALRDASTRLDRAKRFLPDTIDPPVIFKRDPSQIPIMEFAVSSRLRDPSELRAWIDYELSRWFVNLPGVAAVEVGGAAEREVLVLPDQHRLAGHGLELDDLIEAIEAGNVDAAGGTLRLSRQQITGRTRGRYQRVEDLAMLPIEMSGEGARTPAGGRGIVRLQDVAEIIDGYADERVRVRLNGAPGVKVSMQKQPQANTVEVADAVRRQLDWLHENQIVPDDIRIDRVGDQSIFIRHAIGNAAGAAASGAVLAMIVVFAFLGDLRRTLIIGTGIPIAIMVSLVLMAVSGLTLNVMTLGGLALGVGLLVDNTIVMLENVFRHQRSGSAGLEAAEAAAGEVKGAIVASTSTNLAAVLPFLFIGGLVGLLFRELIATISAAIIASLVVALTLVPALAARVPVARHTGRLRRAVDAATAALGNGYARALVASLRVRWLVPLPFAAAMAWAVPHFDSARSLFLPELDDGRVAVRLQADAGISLDDMDRIVRRVEALLVEQPEVESVFAQSGGAVFGRSIYAGADRSRIDVQLVPRAERGSSTRAWVKRARAQVRELEIAGARVRIQNKGIRGLRLWRGDDRVGFHIKGPDPDVLESLGHEVARRMETVRGIYNVRHTAESGGQELQVVVDRERAADLGLNVERVARALTAALNGIVVTDFVDGPERFDVRVRLPRSVVGGLRDVEQVTLFAPRAETRDGGARRAAVLLGDVAKVELVKASRTIARERQQRIVAVYATVGGRMSVGEANAAIGRTLSDLDVPAGYGLYDAGEADAIAKGTTTTHWLLGLAVFLVLVVMAVQYESLRNPLIIVVGIPFAAVGVAAAISVLDLPISMPVWLGLVMLAGIVVNNAIVLVEYIEQARARGLGMESAVVEAGRLRLRPILMTTLTTVAGMAPLALGLGEGAELLQPLAITIVWGLAFSVLVSLLLIPALYSLFGRRDSPDTPAGAPAAASPRNPAAAAQSHTCGYGNPAGVDRPTAAS